MPVSVKYFLKIKSGFLGRISCGAARICLLWVVGSITALKGIYSLTESDYFAILEVYKHAWEDNRKRQGRVILNSGDVIELSSMDCGGLYRHYGTLQLELNELAIILCNW